MIIAPLCSSSSANATFIGRRDCGFLIDIGCSYKALRGYLAQIGTDVCAVKAVFITHEHGDHVNGLRVFAKNNPDVPVFRGISGEVAELADYELTAFRTSHDSEWSVGYTIKRGDTKIAYITDLGEITPEVRSAARGANVVFAESNYCPIMLRNSSYPRQVKDRIRSNVGHLSNADSAEFVCELVQRGATRVILGHLSRENNTPRMAFDTLTQRLSSAGAKLDYDYTLNVAEVQTTGQYINV